MRKIALLACLVLLSLPVVATPETAAPAMAAPETTAPATVAPAIPARLSCETLKARVDAKLQAKGVQIYTLEIVPAEGTTTTDAASAVPAAKTAKGKEVGSCDGGTKRLIYTRGN